MKIISGVNKLIFIKIQKPVLYKTINAKKSNNALIKTPHNKASKRSFASHSSSIFSFENAISIKPAIKPTAINSSVKLLLFKLKKKFSFDETAVFAKLNLSDKASKTALSSATKKPMPQIKKGTAKNQPIRLKRCGKSNFDSMMLLSKMYKNVNKS